jgi:hypothetical protein
VKPLSEDKHTWGTFERVFFAFLIASVTYPVAYLGSQWIISRRPDYDLYGRQSYETASTTWFLVKALFPLLLMAFTATGLKLAGSRRWFLPLIAGPFAALAPKASLC